MTCSSEERWRVRFAADLAAARQISLVDGVIWLRRDALRIVLLDAIGTTVDARFLREGESIDVGGIVSFPCHFARVWGRAPAIAAVVGEGGLPSGAPTAAHAGANTSSAVHGGPNSRSRPPPLTDGPGLAWAWTGPPWG